MASNLNKLVGKKIANRYCITDEIGRGGMGVVYRAIPFSDPSQSVAIKVIRRNKKLASEDLLRFQKEASLMSQLHHPNIICFHELGLYDDDSEDSFEGGYYIVMELANGCNLKDSLGRDGRKDLAFFFQVGLQVSAALDETHGKNIIHRDIKPQNIIVSTAWREQRGVVIKVLDFGVARLAEAMHYTDREGNVKRFFEDFAGTPLYMAPEQTKLFEAAVDHRVDLYSLGCVLYEILAGRPPFTGSTREKLEKQHVFSDPEPLSHVRPDIPAIIEKIVHKLLAKHPDERYQTAFGLHADLLRAKTKFEKGSSKSSISFPLGLKDRFQAVSAQLTLVGREKELQALIDGYAEASTEQARSRLTVIRGSAGVGKSRLLAEFRSYLAKRKIRFVSGSFFQHENALPLNALANAFNEYLLKVIKSQPNEVEELRRKIKATLGPMAHQIAEVVPGLKPYLSDVPETVEVEFEKNVDNFRNFAKMFSDFTRCLATDDQPVVFMFDDLHWADGKSLELIDQFFSHNNAQRFYMIVTHRTIPEIEKHGVGRFIEKFRKLRRRFHEIDLNPIDIESVTHITGNMLASSESIRDDLVAYLGRESKGNPRTLVELVRFLVARDLISPRYKSSLWDYNVVEILKYPVKLSTVDLVLSRIQDSPEYDRRVLEIAACIGITFQFEVLLLTGRTQNVSVMKVLQRAVEEGFIARVTDEEELKHLGKTFTFNYSKVRDALYESIDKTRRRELHQAIGERLEEAFPAPPAKIIFALAHHFNCSLDEDGKATSEKLAKKCLRHNLDAGKVAWKTGSWQSAETYFENALKILDDWNELIAPHEEKAMIIENLADLAAVQRQHGKALRNYRQLLEMNLPFGLHAVVAFKTIYLQIVGGIVSESIGLLKYTLQRFKETYPSKNPFSLARAFISIYWDALPISKQRTRLYRILKSAFSMPTKLWESQDRNNQAIRLYQSGEWLYLKEDPAMSLLFHSRVMTQATKLKGSPDSLLRAVAERSAVLGYFGMVKMSYSNFDLVMEVSQSLGLRSAYGYAALLKVLTLDYLKSRHDELSGDLNEAMTYLSPNEDHLPYGMGLLFKIFRELKRGDLETLFQFAQRMPSTIPTRNWLSPRAVAMTLFAHLLQGARDSIVKKGDTFLKRRVQVAGRTNDLFINMINTLVSFAKGETDKTREYFSETIQDFVTSKKREFLFPFEEDFIGLFSYTFPLLFEQEYGRRLMRDSEMRELLLKLQRRIQQICGLDRSIPLLLIARSMELLGKERVRPIYDEALRAAKVGNHKLIMVLDYLWFGANLIHSGHGQKRDYVRRAYVLAKQMGLTALEQYTVKLLDQDMLVEVQAESVVSKSEEGKVSVFSDFTSRVVLQHLKHVTEALEFETKLPRDLEESFRLFRQFYNVDRIFCIVTANRDRKPLILYPSQVDGDIQKIVNYISPYFNIRSTLFLPLNDAPWIAVKRFDARKQVGANQGQSATSAGTEAGDGLSSISSSILQLVQGDSIRGSDGVQGDGLSEVEDTLVVNDTAEHERQHSTQPATRTETMSAEDTSSNVSQSLIENQKRGSRCLQMSALIPLRSDAGNLGVVFVEDMGELQNKDTTFCRHELDLFGTQLGLLIDRKTTWDIPPITEGVTEVAHVMGVSRSMYQLASYTIEEVPWLKIWWQGKLRTRRETAWYLGLVFGQSHYLIAYCQLMGVQSVRERLSSMIWHHLVTMRSLAITSGRNYIELNEIRDDLAGMLRSVEDAAHLENISLAFTVLNLDKKTAYSGHFGPARPLVAGVENVVNPHNDVVLHLSNARDLRYWEVTASLATPHVYLLSYDLSKMDYKSIDVANAQVMASLVANHNAFDLSRILEQALVSGNLPRYYVAAIINPFEQIRDLPALDKAE